MTSPDEDGELDELLARRSPLSRDYASLGEEQPPAPVDRTILAAAKHAVRLAERPIGHSRPRWMIPVTLAATVVVSFSILYGLGRDPTPVVERMVAEMRGTPPPVVVTLEPPASPAMEPAPVTASPAASAERLAAQRPTRAPVEVTEMARQAAKADSKARRANRADQPMPAAALAKEAKGLNAARAPPPAALVGETAVVAAPMDALEGRAAAAPALTGADLERAIAFLRAPPVRSGGSAASSKGEAWGAQGVLAKRGTDADARLQDLQHRYDAGDKAAALAALVKFRESFPQHPLSQLLNRPQP